ncbi:MAG: MFS transporter [Phycisphaerae bacterium]|nr:MFS transporter [Phycisphaerae bacterium]
MRIDPKWSVLVAVGVGTFMGALDGSVANTVLPVIGRSFRAGLAEVEWVTTVYLLCVSGLLLALGRLGDLRGHRRVYLAGFGVFVAGSGLCGLSPSVPALVVFRAVQAVGGAMVMSNSPAILTQHFPSTQRGQALGIQAAMTYLGLCAGPSLGGWLAAHLGWRAVFFINIPVGLLAIVLSLRSIPPDAPASPGREERFDLAGAGTFLAGLVALLLALNRGHDWGWASPAVLGLVGAACALGLAFLWIERRCAQPMLDLGLFRSRSFSAAAASALLNYLCMSAATFGLPFYLIQARGLDASQAGIILAAQPVVMALAAPLSGTLSDRLGTRLVATPGMAILGIGLWVPSRLQVDSPMAHVTAGLAVVGLGAGIFVSPNNSALLGAAPAHRRGIASGVLATARNVGMVVGVGLVGAILATAQAQAADEAGGVVTGMRWGFLGAVGLAALGMVFSAVRGRRLQA